jgi:hypothetical protein
MTRNHAGREVLDHHVDLGYEVADYLVTGGILEVDTDALLAAILLHEVAAAAVAQVWQMA